MNIEPEKRPKYLLTKSDPSPVNILNGNFDHPLLLVCEHAGQAIPKSLNGLGISNADLDSHIGWDIGAEAVTRGIAEALGAPAVLQRYSRLVIDCNRPPDAPDGIPETSHKIEIPGNRRLKPNARNARRQEIFEPFQHAVSNCFERHPRRIVLSIHSFNPKLDGTVRPWDVSFLFRKDSETSRYLSDCMHEMHPDLIIGMNEPYQIDNDSDWFVPHHGEAQGVAHSLIEIRNDLIRTPEDQAKWAQNLTAAITRFLRKV